MAPSETTLPSADGAAANPPAIHPSFLPLLDADFIEYYTTKLATRPSTHSLGIAELRADPTRFASPWYRDFSSEPFVSDRRITSSDGHPVTVRCYAPDPATSPYGTGPYPVYVNFHGGGFVLGSLLADAEICMEIRNRLGIMVVDSNYRKCPENEFGKGMDDAWAAVRWVHEKGPSELNIRSDSIAVGGISAGGHIAASVHQLARDAGIKLRLAILAVPILTIPVDGTSSPESSPYESMRANALAPCLNWARMSWFQSLYLPSTAAARERFLTRPVSHTSPMLGNLEGLCDTVVATAEADPLRDEGEEYARRLVEKGTRVVMRRYRGVPHPFMHMKGIGKAEMYLGDMCGELERVMARPGE